MEQSVLTHSESSHDDRKSGKHRVHNKNLPTHVGQILMKAPPIRGLTCFSVFRIGTLSMRRTRGSDRCVSIWDGITSREKVMVTHQDSYS
jgi:hypothetical protein